MKNVLLTIIIWITLDTIAYSQNDNSLHILILGNSITSHAPNKHLGWEGNWGMAASEQSKDYVHILTDSVNRMNPNAVVTAKNFLFEQRYWEINESDLEYFRKLNADLIILEYGDNVTDKLANSHNYCEHIEKLVISLTKLKKAQIFLTSTFWKRDSLNKSISELAKKNNWNFVFIEDISASKQNTALGKYAFEEVSAHPSDLGMSLIANRLFKKLKPYIK